jgi:hypothetical protein
MYAAQGMETTEECGRGIEKYKAMSRAADQRWRADGWDALRTGRSMQRMAACCLESNLRETEDIHPS